MPTDFDIAIGKNIRRLRMLHGLTQQQLGQKLGISFQQVQKYECGHNQLSARRLHEMCNALHVPVSAMLKEEQGAQLSHGPLHDRQLLHLLQAYRKISKPEKRSLLCAVAEALA